MKHIITLCLLLSFTSCAFIKREGQWGKNAFKFKAQKIGRAFVDNAKDPNVWAPLIGAAVIGFTKQDKKSLTGALKKRRSTEASQLQTKRVTSMRK